MHPQIEHNHWWQRPQPAWLTAFISMVGMLIILGFWNWGQTTFASEYGGIQDVAQTVNSETSTLNYQGFVTDSSGQLLNGTHDFIFRAYPTSIGGEVLWTENHTNIPVHDGLFNVLLGSKTDGGLPNNLWQNPLYLELVFNGETFTPRELVTLSTSGKTLSVQNNIHFLQKSPTNPLIAAYDSTGLHFSASDIPLLNDGGWYRGGWLALTSLDHATNPGSVRVHLARDNALGNSPAFDIYRTHNDGSAAPLFTADSSGDIVVHGLNTKMGGTSTSHIVLRHDGSRTFHLLPWGGAGHAWDQVCIGCGARTNLHVNGSITQGAIIERNLQTEEELSAGHIERFDQGDVLCWDAITQQLAHCTESNSQLVVAVADELGRPIIMGAEPIKVIGVVVAGDLLVASKVAGYAEVWSASEPPPTGVVIAKALEGQASGKGLIKALILNR